MSLVTGGCTSPASTPPDLRGPGDAAGAVGGPDLRGPADAAWDAGAAGDAAPPQQVSYTLPFVDANPLTSEFRLRLSVGGGPDHLVVMDTGSTGIVVPKSALGPGAQITTDPFSIEYSSSGITLTGHWGLGAVRIGVPAHYDPSSPVVYPTTVPMRFGVVESVTCDPKYPSCSTSGDVSGVGMMGVGFDRGVAATPKSVNPFLQLKEIAAGTMHAGYVISRSHVILGLTAAATAGFQALALTPLAGYPGEWDGASLLGCVKLPASAAFGTRCGRVLVDTGIAGGILTTPAALRPTTLATKDPGQLDSGVEVDLTIGQGAPLWTYDYVVGSSAAKTPAYVYLRTTTDGTIHVNTSRRLFALYDYYFDAQGGAVGFRADP